MVPVVPGSSSSRVTPGFLLLSLIQTTEKYLGMQQNLVEAVNDKLGIVEVDPE
jgi:hypothetical protein